MEAGHMSDATASAPGSDDEVGSTAATDGSTLHTSPADHAGSGAGSDSGGSNVDSVSGRVDGLRPVFITLYNCFCQNTHSVSFSLLRIMSFHA